MFFFYTGIATTEIYTLSLHDALPIYRHLCRRDRLRRRPRLRSPCEDQRVRTAQHAGARRTPWWHASDQLGPRSEEHTSELQSQFHLVCRLLLEKKKSTRVHRRLRC